MLSRFGSKRFRHRVAFLLGICWVGDAVALGLATPTSAPVSIGFVLSLWLLVVGMVFCVYIRDDPDDGRGEGDDAPGGGGGGGPPRKPNPDSGPAWWPQFERDFRSYVKDHRVPLRTP